MQFTKTILIALTFFFAASLAHAEISAEKRKEIDLLLKLTGMEKLMDQMMSQMITSFRGSFKEVPDEFWDRFTKKIKTAEFIESIVPLYDKYYTLEDLRAVNAFYSSPAGQRMLSTLPKIMQESMAIGQEWGRKIGQQAVEEIMAEEKKAQQ